MLLEGSPGPKLTPLGPLWGAFWSQLGSPAPPLGTKLVPLGALFLPKVAPTATQSSPQSPKVTPDGAKAHPKGPKAAQDPPKDPVWEDFEPLSGVSWGIFDVVWGQIGGKLFAGSLAHPLAGNSSSTAPSA